MTKRIRKTFRRRSKKKSSRSGGGFGIGLGRKSCRKAFEAPTKLNWLKRSICKKRWGREVLGLPSKEKSKTTTADEVKLPDAIATGKQVTFDPSFDLALDKTPATMVTALPVVDSNAIATVKESDPIQTDIISGTSSTTKTPSVDPPKQTVSDFYATGGLRKLKRFSRSRRRSPNKKYRSKKISKIGRNRHRRF